MSKPTDDVQAPTRLNPPQAERQPESSDCTDSGEDCFFGDRVCQLAGKARALFGRR